MRSATRVLVLVGTMLVPAVIGAKGRPQPPTCPPDVAAAVAAACPCDGSWKNHGEYVRCVAHARNSLRKGHCLDDASRRTMTSCGARSTCGKAGAVVCCPVVTGTCSDPTPDGVPAGTCANNPTVPCDKDADCATRRGHVSHDEASCVSHHGVSDGPGSVCTSACSPSGAFLER